MSEFIWPAGWAGPTPIGRAINRHYLGDETGVVRENILLARLPDAGRDSVNESAIKLVETVRRERKGSAGIEAFLQQYDLGSREGVMLMCIAEALLRIPDAETADKLIAEKINSGNWKEHLGEAESMFVNASTWGLMLTGRVVRPSASDLEDPSSLLERLVARLGEPVVRGAFRQAMRIMGHQFVMGRTIPEALRRASAGDNHRYRYTFDMLGESALTEGTDERYFEAYGKAIHQVKALANAGMPPAAWPSISVKLSALHPRYEYAHHEDVRAKLGPKLEALALESMKAGIAFTIDAEEVDRLELSLELFDRLLALPALDGWPGLGLAVQSYQKRAADLLRWLDTRVEETGRTVNVRLVKGAYWDAEIKRSQERGLPGYPVFTRKPNTDVSFLACARLLLEGSTRLYPQFASHNAHSVAWVMHVAQVNGRDYEFQRLHGMGEELYDSLRDPQGRPVPCRVYAPVGSHEDLLPYLVRRLLENGANTSFVNRIVDESVAAAEIVRDPVTEVEGFQSIEHPRIQPPPQLFGEERTNSMGINLADGAEQAKLADDCRAAVAAAWRAAPVVGGKARDGARRELRNPADRDEVTGEVREANAALADEAFTLARRAQPAWDRKAPTMRAAILDAAALAFEEHRAEFLARCVREAGKTVPDSLAELRQAVDCLRYYAARLRQDFVPLDLAGPTGESNRLELRGRGVFVSLSPFSSPLAAFTGQLAAALAAGNAVLAKPAAQTPLVAAVAVRLLHEAGVPDDVLHFLPGDATLGARLAIDARADGVVVSGSADTVRQIGGGLAGRSGPVPALIAESGGRNAMIADSSALHGQVVQDAIAGAFHDAGQRCTALRVLFVQQDIADAVLNLLAGAMDLLRVGDPALLGTDIGPVIDEAAREALEAYAKHAIAASRWYHRARVSEGTGRGRFVAPLAVEIADVAALPGEVFGPVLHIVRFRADELDRVIDAINTMDDGLALGVHSRIDAVARRVAARARVGNIYVNRNMTGAVVGVQPSGGRGPCGIGAKAGGPRYLQRFAVEQVVTTNIAAVGGNTALLSLID
jgi:RHH-type proline utilization regulon transcriptional repressor/proline dehydrogenase/delta 1-pyrroline-5-carboxylate dehydrogenase